MLHRSRASVFAAACATPLAGDSPSLRATLNLPSDQFHSGIPRRPVRSTGNSISPLDLVRLTPLMNRTRGQPQIAIGLVDGPILLTHPDLAGQRIHQVSGKAEAACSQPTSIACMHGTFVAGILSAKRDSGAPAICPDCTLLVRPIFGESASQNGDLPRATPEELAAAVVETVDMGPRVLNMSAALANSSPQGEHALGDALDYAAQRGVIVVAAAGNQGTVGSSAITRHPWVIPVAGCDLRGKPVSESNLGGSIGRRGLTAPAKGITSLGADGKPRSFGGTSAATPFVTGAIALIWSEFPDARAAEVKLAITGANRKARKTVVPPLLDAWTAYQVMYSARNGRPIP
jgi:subtilisin family serine protease